MNLLDICMLAVALAMDCFTISIVSGVICGDDKRFPWITLQLSFFFGLFQALMPLVGWLGISSFSQWLEAFDHWIAFGLLAFIGINMIHEGFSEKETHTFNPRRLSVQLLLAIATSIDALAIGISFACTGYDHLSQLTLPLVIIGIVSLFFGIVGHWLGARFGHTITHRLKPELLGGTILIIIGIKILISHLYNI